MFAVQTYRMFIAPHCRHDCGRPRAGAATISWSNYAATPIRSETAAPAADTLLAERAPLSRRIHALR